MAAMAAWPRAAAGIKRMLGRISRRRGKDVRKMAACNETKSGEVYVCKACGFEVQVLKSCADTPKGACSCSESLTCCGAPLTLKE